MAATGKHAPTRKFGSLIAVAIGIVALPGLTSCTPPPPQVVVYGDSLAVQSEGAARFLYPRETVIFRAIGGTAMCDAFTQAIADARNLHPRRVVLAFTGNSWTCAHAAYIARGDNGITNLYEQDLRQLRVIFSGVPMTLLIPPACRGSTSPGSWFPFNGNPLLVAMYKRVGVELGMTINNDADNWLSPGHVFVTTRPQLFTGRIVAVRAPDNVHLLPDGEMWYGLALLAGTT
jgi:hypothetical protein